MKIGMMNHPAHELGEEVAFAAEHGFDFIDITIEPPKAQIEDIDCRSIASALKKNNLGSIGHTNFYMPYASAIKRIREASIDELSEQLIFFHELGVKRVSIHPHWYQPNSQIEDIRDRLISSLNTLTKVARQQDIQLMLEHQPNGLFHLPESLLPFFKGVKDLLFHLDVGHAQVAGGKGANLTQEFLVHFKTRLGHVHMSDNRGSTDDHLPIGVGVVDWEDIVGQLTAIHYDKTITLEVFANDRQYLLYSKEKIRSLWKSASERHPRR